MESNLLLRIQCASREHAGLAWGQTLRKATVWILITTSISLRPHKWILLHMPQSGQSAETPTNAYAYVYIYIYMTICALVSDVFFCGNIGYKGMNYRTSCSSNVQTVCFKRKIADTGPLLILVL